MTDAASPNVIGIIHDELVSPISFHLRAFRAMQIDTEKQTSVVRDESYYYVARRLLVIQL